MKEISIPLHYQPGWSKPMVMTIGGMVATASFILGGVVDVALLTRFPPPSTINLVVLPGTTVTCSNGT